MSVSRANCLAATVVVTAALLAFPVSATAQIGLPGDSATVYNSESPPGLSVPRISLDAHLVQAASEASARLVEGSSLESKLRVLADELRSGPHTVASGTGEKAISIIRMLPNADLSTRSVLLSRLESMARDQSPEAQAFFGYASEEGRFGFPKDLSRAARFYQASARAGYQAALYDLALVYAYGRGTPRDPHRAESLLALAANQDDSSGRVCGMAAFLAFRLHDRAGMKTFSANCTSPLAGLAALSVASEAKQPISTSAVALAKASIATGVDDGYSVLESTTRQGAGDDTQFTYCLWALINRFRNQPDSTQLSSEAHRCVQEVAAPGSTVAGLAPMARDAAADGLARSVPTEIETIKESRRENGFHYGQAVPYLPFSQEDAQLFGQPNRLER